MWIAGLLALIAAVPPAYAQSYPSRTIRIVSGYPAGGNNDIGARIFATELESRVKQPVIVENRPGAGDTMGSDPADGSVESMRREAEAAIRFWTEAARMAKYQPE